MFSTFDSASRPRCGPPWWCTIDTPPAPAQRKAKTPRKLPRPILTIFAACTNKPQPTGAREAGRRLRRLPEMQRSLLNKNVWKFTDTVYGRVGQAPSGHHLKSAVGLHTVRPDSSIGFFAVRSLFRFLDLAAKSRANTQALTWQFLHTTEERDM